MDARDKTGMNDGTPFHLIAGAVTRQLEKMIKAGSLHKVGADKNELWDLYLSSFPPGVNEMFRSRRQYDCQHCKQFIRQAGALVAIDGERTVTVWDAESPDPDMQVVFDAMAAHVRSKPIVDVFRHPEPVVGVPCNHQDTDSGVVTWNHFSMQVPAALQVQKGRLGSVLGTHRTRKEVLFRSLNELTLSAAEIVLDLIAQQSLYRGEEHKVTVQAFMNHKKAFDKLGLYAQDLYCWVQTDAYGIRNTVIGSLITDLSEGVALDDAVRMFESKVAPANYKRPKALITKRMIQAAEDQVAELGIENSLHRRCAVAGDITVNNVLFADRSIRPAMSVGVFDELRKSVPEPTQSYSEVDEIAVDDFIKDVLPKAETIELLLEDDHLQNLMTLVAPSNAEAPNILQWGNNFSWSYSGDVADSMKERVKSAGGKVDGVLRFSIQWNDNADCPDDLDAHCREPGGNHIFFNNKHNHLTTGDLDVDIMTPGRNVAVENITWSDRGRMAEGAYTFFVHNYHHRGGRSGFTAEIEFENRVFTFHYPEALSQDHRVAVAQVIFSRAGGFEITESMEKSQRVREVWGLATHKFHRVTMAMNSPNHWDGEKKGNRHHFFILDGCATDEPVRGFYNEYLREDFREHRKVFEVLGSRLKAEPVADQLSGLGFSSTRRASVVCKVSGSFNRVVRINF